MSKDDGSGFLPRFRLLRGPVRLLTLLLPIAVALFDFLSLGLARSSFVFYAIDDGLITIENRMLARSPSRELNIARYVEEALLGPSSPNCLPLFPRETRLRSLLYRDGVVYADITEEAVMPPLEGGEVYKNFKTLDSGIKRNFAFVRDVHFFIAGKPAYEGEFRQEGGEWERFLSAL
jgi:hypothetical protein